MQDPSAEVTVMQRRISPERLGPYLAATGGDLTAALDLYVHNAEVSAALATTIGHVEVVLRNAMHESLTAWSSRRFGEPAWYLDPGRLLRSQATDDIRTARERATRQGHAETSGRVVAELNLGFWRFLLATCYDGTLWREALYQVFPGQPRRRTVYATTEVLHLARNRLAHHEPMFNRPVADNPGDGAEAGGLGLPGQPGVDRAALPSRHGAQGSVISGWAGVMAR